MHAMIGQETTTTAHPVQARAPLLRVSGASKVLRPSRSSWAVGGEFALEVLIRVCGVSAVIFVLAIFFFVFREAVPVLMSPEFSLREFLFSSAWYPTSVNNVRYGTLALITGTACVSGLAVLIAVPFSLGAAISISEFCGPRLKETLKIVIELLAAIPSVVWGFIGLTVTSKIVQELTGAPVGVNILNGGIILALMCVPIITSIAEDALKAVPDSYREAALALGATRWQIVYRVLLPAAKTGLLAAVLLGRWPSCGRDHGRADGDRSCRAYSGQHPGLRSHADSQYRGGIRRGARAFRPLPRSVSYRGLALPDHLRRERDG
jgi:phosphate transport system permease protein